MKKFLISFLSLCAIVSAQVQLFENGASGLVVKPGANIHPDIIDFTTAIEYTIEGKFTIGGFYSTPIEDSLFQKWPGITAGNYTAGSVSVPVNAYSKARSTSFGGYFSFEVIEPDRTFPLSFAIDVSYFRHSLELDLPYVDTTRATVHTLPLVSFERHYVTGGPVMGARFYLGSNSMIVPTAAYALNYVIESRKDIKGGILNKTAFVNDDLQPIEDSKLFMHDAKINCLYNIMFNSIIGMSVHPGLTLRIGGDPKIDFFGTFQLGLVLKLSRL
ncbi:MAG: hypothetical protein HQK83_18025 [Fibrobacteria bacterium]|nr:hypothetical protein [Fibrobacteria bacterium]